MNRFSENLKKREQKAAVKAELIWSIIATLAASLIALFFSVRSSSMTGIALSISIAVLGLASQGFFVAQNWGILTVSTKKSSQPQRRADTEPDYWTDEALMDDTEFDNVDFDIGSLDPLSGIELIEL